MSRKIATLRVPEETYQHLKLCKEIMGKNTWNSTINYILKRGLQSNSNDYINEKLLPWEKKMWKEYGVYFYPVRERKE